VGDVKELTASSEVGEIVRHCDLDVPMLVVRKRKAGYGYLFTMQHDSGYYERFLAGDRADEVYDDIWDIL
jgi:hypothetical protein